MAETNNNKRAGHLQTFGRNLGNRGKEGVDKHATLNNTLRHQYITSSSSSKKEETKDYVKYFSELSIVELVEAFVMLGLVSPEYSLRHEQLVMVIGRPRYIRLGLHCMKHGKDGGGKLFTWYINREIKK